MHHQFVTRAATVCVVHENHHLNRTHQSTPDQLIRISHQVRLTCKRCWWWGSSTGRSPPGKRKSPLLRPCFPASVQNINPVNEYSLRRYNFLTHWVLDWVWVRDFVDCLVWDEICLSQNRPNGSSNRKSTESLLLEGRTVLSLHSLDYSCSPRTLGEGALNK